MRKNRGGSCRPCEEVCSRAETYQICTPEGRFLRGGNPLLNRFKDGVQGKGNRNPFPWRAFSFCPLSLCTSKEKMDTEQPHLLDKQEKAGLRALDFPPAEDYNHNRKRGAGYARLREGDATPETLEPDPDNAGVGSTMHDRQVHVLWICLFAFLPPKKKQGGKQT